MNVYKLECKGNCLNIISLTYFSRFVVKLGTAYPKKKARQMPRFNI